MSAAMARAPRNAAPGPEHLFNDICRRTIVTIDMLRSPFPVLVFILNLCRLAGRALLQSHALGGLHGRFVARKGFREYTVELVGPPAVLLDDPISDFSHVAVPLACTIHP